MTRAEIISRFPNASDSFVRRNESSITAVGRRNVDIEKAWKDYGELKSLHKVAAIHGTHAETLRVAFAEAGLTVNSRRWTKEDESKLTELRATKTAKEAAGIIGRSKASVDLRWSRLNRNETTTGSGSMSVACENCREIFKTFSTAQRFCSVKCFTKSPRFLSEVSDRAQKKRKSFNAANCERCGKLIKITAKCPSQRFCSQECAQRSMSVIMKRITATRANPENKKTTYKSCWRGWIEIGGKRMYVRSSWEANYARYLEFRKARGEILEWEYEPETFWFLSIRRGCRSYLPDFRITHTDSSVEYIEVKGWMNPKSITKLKRMKKFHPDVKVTVIDGSAYRSLQRSVRSIIKGWTDNRQSVPDITPEEAAQIYSKTLSELKS